MRKPVLVIRASSISAVSIALAFGLILRFAFDAPAWASCGLGVLAYLVCVNGTKA